MKELNEIVCSSKRAFCFKKRHLCMTKGHLNNPEGLIEVQSPPNKKLSLVHFTYMKKKVFFKKSTFNEASDSRMFYLYKIGPECIILVILFLKDGSLSKMIY